MTQDEIKAARATLDDKLAEAQGEVERLRLEIRILQTRCHHPSEFKTCHMGETAMHCPDCGHE